MERAYLKILVLKAMFRINPIYINIIIIIFNNQKGNGIIFHVAIIIL